MIIRESSIPENQLKEGLTRYWSSFNQNNQYFNNSHSFFYSIHLFHYICYVLLERNHLMQRRLQFFVFAVFTSLLFFEGEFHISVPNDSFVSFVIVLSFIVFSSSLVLVFFRPTRIVILDSCMGVWKWLLITKFTSLMMSTKHYE